MQMLRKGGLVVALLGGAAMAWSAAGIAQMGGPEMGFYVGGALGQVKHKEGCDGVPSGISCDSSDQGWKIFGGYQLNRNFAAELAYTDLGETKFSDPTDSITIRPTAWEIVAVGMYPFAQGFTLYGKLGFYRAETQLDSTIGLSDKDSNNDLTFGFGGRYDFNRNFGVRLEWQRYADVGGEDIGTSDVDMFSVGVLWRF
jgi:OmpA-OmpF porin, OOP family